MRKNLVGFGAVALLAAACGACAAGVAVTAKKPSVASAPVASVSAAPSASVASAESEVPPGFEGATGWVNVDHPLTMKELEGRVVVVDFWTSCCINCIQTLPTLKALETQFGKQPFVVVGVHSPKFEAEHEASRLRSIAAAYDIHHPIAVDGDMKVWEAWGVRAWPTVAVLDPHGHVVWADGGEPNLTEITGVVSRTLDQGRADKSLTDAPLAGLEGAKSKDQPLAFPGKVIGLADGGLAVSDTGHHRVVVLEKTGAVRFVVGTGTAGRDDGDAAHATFRGPQGLAEDGGRLFVADTQNHLIRAIDLKTRSVTTIAGTGALGKKFLGADVVVAKDAELRSPWDVLVVKKKLYVALAGSHQIGELDLAKGTLRRLAGSGREARLDGPAEGAAFAQPSSLASDGKDLFVLDSETSSVRRVGLSSGAVSTIVGKDLFVFGDVDGDKDTARLQHPIGLAYANGELFVADSYNSKVKRVDPKTGAVVSLPGADRKALFEPAGLMVRGGELIVADTQNSRLAELPIKGGEVKALATTGLSAPPG